MSSFSSSRYGPNIKKSGTPTRTSRDGCDQQTLMSRKQAEDQLTGGFWELAMSLQRAHYSNQQSCRVQNYTRTLPCGSHQHTQRNDCCCVPIKLYLQKQAGRLNLVWICSSPTLILEEMTEGCCTEMEPKQAMAGNSGNEWALRLSAVFPPASCGSERQSLEFLRW